MRTKRLQCVLSFLALLQGTVHAGASSVAECTAQAWVRAPDLTPDTVIQGDARVKISVGCPTAETVLLGLRLKERSFVKALRSPEDKKWMNSAPVPILSFQQTSPWAFPPSHFPNRSDDVRFQEILADKNLWLVKEEERFVFETTQAIHMGGETAEGRVVVQDFAVLVPSTNFPPALDYLNSAFVINAGEIEIVDLESIYEYFIRISFANGTTEDIAAGFTGFQPLHNPADTPRWPISETAPLESMRPGKDSPITNYTAQISTTSGLVFTEGSNDQVVTVVITRTGPARTFAAPLTVRGCVEPTFSPKWTVEYDVLRSRPMHRPGYILRSTLEDVEDAKRNSYRPSCYSPRGTTVSVTMPNSTSEEIQSGDIVTTTSAAVTIPIGVDRRQITNFETYYQTLANALMITLEMPQSGDETVDPDDPSAEVPIPWSPDVPDDDEPWVPWEKKQSGMPGPRFRARYTGKVPVVVRPIREITPSQGCLRLSADGSDQVVLSGETGCEQHSLVYYLDEGARGPTFVDSRAVHELLAEDPTERARRAPILEPVLSSPPEGEEHVYRYYRRPNLRTPIYVGETWARKVANKSEREVRRLRHRVGIVGKSIQNAETPDN